MCAQFKCFTVVLFIYSVRMRYLYVPFVFRNFYRLVESYLTVVDKNDARLSNPGPEDGEFLPWIWSSSSTVEQSLRLRTRSES